MPIVRVPDVVVRERVDIRVRLTIDVDVHVSNGYCRMSHLYHRRSRHTRDILHIRDRAVFY